MKIHIEKSPTLGEQSSGPFPAVCGARRHGKLGSLTVELQPGNLAGDRVNESCGSGPAPSKADTGRASYPRFSVQGGWVLTQPAQVPCALEMQRGGSILKRLMVQSEARHCWRIRAMVT